MIVLYALGFLIASPLTFLSWVFFFRPHRNRGTFERVRVTKRLAIIWDVDNESKFYKQAMSGWYGFVLGANICVVDVPSKDTPWWEKHLKHEEKGHVIQQYIFGVLFIPLYALFTGFIWLFLRSKHSYLDNPFERWARRVAGQKINIPKEEWPNGPNDRFPFW